MIGWLRLIGFVEAVSFLLLLLVAMPLKYGAGRDEAVQVLGMAHGVLFLILLLAIAAAYARGLSPRLAGLCAVAAVVPTGPFWIDGKLKAAQAGTEQADVAG